MNTIYGGKIIKVIQRKYYDIVHEDKITMGLPKGKTMMMKYALSPEGNYIGSTKCAYRLNKKYGITHFQLASPNHKVCSIGFNFETKQWYGWSHRAIFGFKIGDEVKKGDCCAISGWTDEYLKKHPEEDDSLPIGFKATNQNEVKAMAIAFAKSVS